jgi:hypothetical protein
MGSPALNQLAHHFFILAHRWSLMPHAAFYLHSTLVYALYGKGFEAGRDTPCREYGEPRNGNAQDEGATGNHALLSR